MNVALSSDHRGYRAKERIKAFLKAAGHNVVDFGCDGPTSCDYPDHHNQYRQYFYIFIVHNLQNHKPR